MAESPVVNQSMFLPAGARAEKQPNTRQISAQPEKSVNSNADNPDMKRRIKWYFLFRISVL